MAGIAGLLAAVSLTGCAAAQQPAAAGPVEQPTSTPAPVIVATAGPDQFAQFDASRAVVDAEWTGTFGSTPEVRDAVVKNGVAIVSAMYAGSPEYTLQGRGVSDEDVAEGWGIVSTKLRPLVSDVAFNRMTKEWEEKQSYPMLTGHKKLQPSGEYSYTFTTVAGENCTVSAVTPYEVSLESVNLSARADTVGTKIPQFDSEVNVVITCEEGGKLLAKKRTTFLMQQVGDKWLLADAMDISTVGKNQMLP